MQQTTSMCRHTGRKNPSYGAGGPSISLRCLKRSSPGRKKRLTSSSHLSLQTFVLPTEETYPIDRVPTDTKGKRPTVLPQKRPVGTSSTITGRHSIEILPCRRQPKILVFQFYQVLANSTRSERGQDAGVWTTLVANRCYVIVFRTQSERRSPNHARHSTQYTSIQYLLF